MHLDKSGFSTWAAVRWLMVLPGLVVACGPPDATVSVAYRAAAPLSLAGLTVVATDGGHRWTWRGSEFQPDPQNGDAPSSPKHETQTSGSLILDFRFADGADPITAGTVTLPLQSDWEWGVSIMLSTADPAFQCMGCAGSKALPLPPAYRQSGRDSVWLVWGGNSIRHPVVY